MPELSVSQTVEILLVEDSPSDVRLLREAMRDSPARAHITVARDGVEAMEVLGASLRRLAPRPDVIILDLNLPKMNGREVLAAVKADPSLKQIPVLVLTSSKADDDIYQAYSLNANCYISKPNDLNGYIEIVRAIEDFWFVTAILPEGIPGNASFSAPTAELLSHQ